MVEQTEDITDDEAVLYDRQIRLWGLEAQRRLRASKVLVAGLRGLGAEVCKNVILAGVKSLTILENADVSEDHMCAHYFIDKNDIGKKIAESSLEKLKWLNPMVEVIADTDDVAAKTEEFYRQFNTVVLIGCSSSVTIRVDHICRKYSIKFFAGDVAGFFGYMFLDLGKHDYSQEIMQTTKCDDADILPTKKRRSDGEGDVKVVKKTLSYVSLENALNQCKQLSEDKTAHPHVVLSYFLVLALNKFHDDVGRRPQLNSQQDDDEILHKIWNDLIEEFALDVDLFGADYIRNCFGETSFVCTIVGGIFTQEIIKAVSYKDQPLNNFFFFNGCDLNGGFVASIGKPS